MGWKRLFKANGIISVGEVRIKGRSFAFPLADGRIAVIKMAKTADDASALRREIRWMSYLSDVRPPGRRRFDVPEPITADGAVLFKLEGLPKEWTSPLNLDAHPVAVGYIASGDYFRYPNPAPSESLPTAEAVLEMMGRNAYLFAWLAGRGIVHEAPIPLFHNRLQQERRRDGGTYEWFRAGRLDRWLASCAYPNFGRSGLRDFEHFVSFDGKQVDLYRSMGNHLLSLLMVAGSYFRAKDPDQTGWDPAGRPVDARYLFDRPLLHKMVNSIYGQYYNGFVGAPPKGKTPLDVDRLVDRMIDEMGVDRHMLEYLRVADQNRMSRSAFEAFLVERGYRADAVAGIEKGARDLDLLTGPHLGAFNRGISIPELIDATAAMAAACMAERFLKSDPVPETTAGR